MKPTSLLTLLLPFSLVVSGCKPDIQVEHKAPINTNRKHQLADLEVRQVKTPTATINVWVMDSDAKRQEGMMYLKDGDVADDEGMVFIFDSAGQQAFWMHHTLIPLDICYISPDRKVLNVQHGKPVDDTALPSTGPSDLVIEVKSGRAAKLGLVPGAKIELLNIAKPR